MHSEKKSVEVKSRMEPSLKNKAEKYLRHYDINTSHAIKLFYMAVVQAKGLPFDLRPNIETQKAMKEHETGELDTYDTYDEMMKDIKKE